MNETSFKYVEECSETNITENNSFQRYFLNSSQVNWADLENSVEFLSKEMPDIKIDDNCLFEVEKRLNVYLNSNKFEQLENQHAEKLLKDPSPHFKNEHIPYENVMILVEFTLCCPGTNAVVERGLFSW
ncbi:uncharacterized protein TNCV_665381 [Trichonephila clavipes]|uniref:Uncharacterized protein n=1 Tax=Trichonephila clavipes TaxID=2585209 RepID=A0A8X6SPQ8_TRICX|nr:uncharacterized protein TNCV_665381 [Trichonephila clavipes]